MSLRSTADILRLLDALQEHVADELEGQDLDFKEWIARSVRDARAQVIDMAVCMANGGGGTVVFGVADKVRGRARAIVGVPGDIDVPALTSAIYNGTDPKITAAFEELSVPVERGGAGRGTFWTLAPDLHERLAEPGQVLRDRRLDWEAAKARVLSLLVERARRGQPGLANADLRQITRLSRRHVLRLMQELMTAHPEVQPPGRGRWGRYRYESGQPAAD